jgi:glycosyltransferase involved in cell wall biosynthesis
MVFIGKESASVKSTMLDYAEKHHIANRLVFMGEQADVLPFVRHSSAMLFPSLWEGLPGALIESASVGTAVLASAIPSVKEVASQLPIVRFVELSESDEVWASQLKTWVDEKPDYQTSIDTFNQSSFLLNANVDKLHGFYTE